MNFSQNDRDMLIRHDLKMVALCTTVKDMNKLLISIDKKLSGNDVLCIEKRSACRKDINKELKRFFTKKVLMWIIGFIIVSIFGLIGFTGTLSRTVSVNAQRIIDFHQGDL